MAINSFMKNLTLNNVDDLLKNENTKMKIRGSGRYFVIEDKNHKTKLVSANTLAQHISKLAKKEGSNQATLNRVITNFINKDEEGYKALKEKMTSSLMKASRFVKTLTSMSQSKRTGMLQQLIKPELSKKPNETISASISAPPEKGAKKDLKGLTLEPVAINSKDQKLEKRLDEFLSGCFTSSTDSNPATSFFEAERSQLRQGNISKKSSANIEIILRNMQTLSTSLNKTKLDLSNLSPDLQIKLQNVIRRSDFKMEMLHFETFKNNKQISRILGEVVWLSHVEELTPEQIQKQDEDFKKFLDSI
jgi:hypothetical protein